MPRDVKLRREYDQPWEFLLEAYLKRFPTTKHIPILLGSDILEEEHDEEAGYHYVLRKTRAEPEFPAWIRKFFGVEELVFIQDMKWNTKRRSLVIHITNETYKDKVTLDERTEYFVHPDNPDWTAFFTAARLSMRDMYRCEGILERLGASLYLRHSNGGSNIDMAHLEELLMEKPQMMRDYFTQREQVLQLYESEMKAIGWKGADDTILPHKREDYDEAYGSEALKDLAAKAAVEEQ